MPSETLVILAKYWEPGKVKTRLAESLGAERAAELHRRLLECSLRRFAAEKRKLLLAYAPGDPATGERFGTANLEGWDLKPQVEEDLGQRMRSILEEQLAAGSDAIVLLGADCPHLPPRIVDEAFDHLRNSEVVLGPSEDGGYYLLGASKKVPPIFGNIPWSTEKVWRETLERLKAAGIGYRVLETSYDVDRPADLDRLLEGLAGTEDPQLCELRAYLQEAIGD